MTDARQQALEYAHENNERFVDELKDFLAIPSISTRPENNEDVRRAAEWVAEQLRSLGMENVQVMPTGGHPVVYGEHLKAGKNAPTVLIYGHYDVQPVDPLLVRPRFRVVGWPVHGSTIAAPHDSLRQPVVRTSTDRDGHLR